MMKNDLLFHITINAERKYVYLTVCQMDFRPLTACGAGLEASGVDALVFSGLFACRFCPEKRKKRRIFAG
jgi:hypothetical protein